MKIAQFPWDPPPPAPTPAAAAAPAATQASSGPQQTGTPSYTTAQLSPPSGIQPDWSNKPANGLPGPQNSNGQQYRQESSKQDPPIKQEPGLSSNPAPANVPQYGNGAPGSLAAQRAANHLQSQYGDTAAASIRAIHGYGQGAQQGGQVQRPPPNGSQGQAVPAQSSAHAHAQYSQQMRLQAERQSMMAQQPAQQRPGPAQQNPSQQNNSGQNGFQQSQVDGAADGDAFEGVLMSKNEKGETTEMGRVDIDRMLHKEMVSRAKAMEGGGFMVTLKEATKSNTLARKSGPSGPSTFDGGLDTELKREDEDETIGSDLDDPNEPDVEEDDDATDQIMLCMYDKVQRVKNKW